MVYSNFRTLVKNFLSSVVICPQKADLKRILIPEYYSRRICLSIEVVSSETLILAALTNFTVTFQLGIFFSL
jgi:hypothetical protein